MESILVKFTSPWGPYVDAALLSELLAAGVIEADPAGEAE